MKVNIIVLTLGFLSFATISLAEWHVDQEIDSMTDETTKTATVKNESGHSFSIYHPSKDGPIWATFALAAGNFDQIDSQKPPVYRVDKNKPFNLALLKGPMAAKLGLHLYEWEPKWINFQIGGWRGEDRLATPLIHLMTGQKILFRYYLSTGGYKETSFTLAGAPTSIAEAIGISPEIDLAAQLKENERVSAKHDQFTDAFFLELKECQENTKCISRVFECREQARSDLDNFRSCMQ